MVIKSSSRPMSFRHPAGSPAAGAGLRADRAPARAGSAAVPPQRGCARGVWPPRRSGVRLPGARALAALMAAFAFAQVCAQDLTELSLEQLTRAEVYGVSKAQERLLDAPASVSVVTAEDIRTFGYRTLADVLNGARGFFTYTDRAYAFIGVRGFAPLGDYNTRVLLLIDGYRTNDNFYDQAAIGTDALIDLDLVERVELIRGPSSSVYGTNAFFGVINVVTKAAARVGDAFTAGVGSARQRILRGSVAGRIGDSGGYLLRVSRERDDGLDIVLNDPSGTLPFGARASGVDGSDTRRVFGKASFGAWRVNVAHMERRKDTGYGLYASDFPDPASFARDIASIADVRYDRPLGNAADVAVHVFAGRYRYRDRSEYGGDPYLSFSGGDWYGAEGQVRHRLAAGHRLIAGVEAQRDARLDQQQNAESLGVLLDDRRSGSRIGVYAQDDREWSARWSSSAGARYDRYRGGEQLSPRVAAIYRPNAGSSLKLIAGSAFRAPNNYERYYALPGLYLSNPSLEAEKIRTLDLDYEAMLGRHTRLAFSLFRLRAMNLIAQVVEPSTGEAQYRNIATANVRGFDVELEHAFGAALRVRGVYSYQHAEDGADTELENSPRHIARLSAWWQWRDGWRLAGEAIHLARRRTATDIVPSQQTLNLAVSSPGTGAGFDVVLGVFNALDRRLEAPVAPGGLPLDIDRIPQPGRTWQLRIGYAF